MTKHYIKYEEWYNKCRGNEYHFLANKLNIAEAKSDNNKALELSDSFIIIKDILNAFWYNWICNNYLEEKPQQDYEILCINFNFKENVHQETR